ncbi:helix-turn-helix domain-containing protein [Rivularia sp. PCC 7116]|uniref:helix-turn-helix domain-containing protein n=1 Tax=Rivularia sp. PCC 7116 TaxID=373994 RepID=UPI003526D120
MKFKLREIREARGYTRQKLAEECKVSISTIQDYENDTRKQFARELLIRFCELLDCTPNDLFEITDNAKAA